MLRVDPDGPGIGKLLVSAVAGEAEGVIVIGFGQLRLTGSSMGNVTIKAQDPGIKVATLLKIEPLLVMGFGMGLRISPVTGVKLAIVGEGLSYLIRFVILVIPGVFKGSVWNADPPRVALTAYLQTSFVRQFSGLDDLSLSFGRLDVFRGRARAMTSFTSVIELNISGLVPSCNFLQLQPGIVATRTAHFKGFLHSGLFETPLLIVPVLPVIGTHLEVA